MSEQVVYVCDRCGYLEERPMVPVNAEWTCEACNGHTAWEYPVGKRGNAEIHAAHIAAPIKSGLFRKVRS